MRTLYTIEPAKPGVRKATTLAQSSGDINRVSVCYNGVQGYINRSGAILCRPREAKKILNHKTEISKLMRELFGDAFKTLLSADHQITEAYERENKLREALLVVLIQHRHRFTTQTKEIVELALNQTK